MGKLSEMSSGVEYVNSTELKRLRKQAEDSAKSAFEPMLHGLGIEKPIVKGKIVALVQDTDIDAVTLFDWELASEEYFELCNVVYQPLYTNPRRLFKFVPRKRKKVTDPLPYDLHREGPAGSTYYVPVSELIPVNFDVRDLEDEDSDFTASVSVITPSRKTTNVPIPTSLDLPARMGGLPEEHDVSQFDDYALTAMTIFDKLAIDMQAPVSNKAELNRRIILARKFQRDCLHGRDINPIDLNAQE